VVVVDVFPKRIFLEPVLGEENMRAEADELMGEKTTWGGATRPPSLLRRLESLQRAVGLDKKERE